MSFDVERKKPPKHLFRKTTEEKKIEKWGPGKVIRM